MSLKDISAGNNPPTDVNVVIEIPSSSNVKYEIDDKTGAIMVDRFVATPMIYPLNYGFIPNTLGDDGDPLDVLVITPHHSPLFPGTVIRSRPVGVLDMEDEAGGDSKILCVPHTKVTTYYDGITEIDQLPQLLRDQVEHFFEHYKDLEPGKWVKIKEWLSSTHSLRTIEKAVAEKRKG